jgi:hypothetical protein
VWCGFGLGLATLAGSGVWLVARKRRAGGRAPRLRGAWPAAALLLGWVGVSGYREIALFAPPTPPPRLLAEAQALGPWRLEVALYPRPADAQGRARIGLLAWLRCGAGCVANPAGLALRVTTPDGTELTRRAGTTESLRVSLLREVASSGLVVEVAATAQDGRRAVALLMAPAEVVLNRRGTPAP